MRHACLNLKVSEKRVVAAWIVLHLCLGLYSLVTTIMGCLKAAATISACQEG